MHKLASFLSEEEDYKASKEEALQDLKETKGTLIQSVTELYDSKIAAVAKEVKKHEHLELELMSTMVEKMDAGGYVAMLYTPRWINALTTYKKRKQMNSDDDSETDEEEKKVVIPEFFKPLGWSTSEYLSIKRMTEDVRMRGFRAEASFDVSGPLTASIGSLTADEKTMKTLRMKTINPPLRCPTDTSLISLMEESTGSWKDAINREARRVPRNHVHRVETKAVATVNLYCTVYPPAKKQRIH